MKEFLFLQEKQIIAAVGVVGMCVNCQDCASVGKLFADLWEGRAFFHQGVNGFSFARAAVFHIPMMQEDHPTINRYMVRGTYHAATTSRQARTKPPITPPIMKFSANRAIPPPIDLPPGTIQRHIRWRSNGSPQSIQSHT